MNKRAASAREKMDDVEKVMDIILGGATVGKLSHRPSKSVLNVILAGILAKRVVEALRPTRSSEGKRDEARRAWVAGVRWEEKNRNALMAQIGEKPRRWKGKNLETWNPFRSLRGQGKSKRGGGDENKR